MLDDLKLIHTRDSQDALGAAEKQERQYLQKLAVDWAPPRPIYDVVVAAAGTSALVALAYTVTGGLHVPFEIVQDYELPGYVHENTLLVCLSYDGDDEEPVRILEQVLDKDSPYPQPMVVIVSSGGELLRQAEAHKLPQVILPAGYQPDRTFALQYRALTELFAATPLKDGELPLLEAAAERLSEYVQSWLPAVPMKNNSAKQIALEVIGKSPVMYAGPQLWPAALWWKSSFNRNAKQVAWAGRYPDFIQGELAGWTQQPVHKPYAIIELRSGLEDSRVRKSIELSERLLSGKRPSPIVVDVAGETMLEQLLWTVAFGDFITMYTALLNGLDPAPAPIVQKFKRLLEEK